MSKNSMAPLLLIGGAAALLLLSKKKNDEVGASDLTQEQMKGIADAMKNYKPKRVEKEKGPTF